MDFQRVSGEVARRGPNRPEFRPEAASDGDESHQWHATTLRRAQVIDFVYTDPDTAKTTKTKRVIKRLTGERKTNKSTKENDYEVQFKAPHDGDDCKHFYGYKKLVKWGWCVSRRLLSFVRVASMASGGERAVGGLFLDFGAVT